MCRSFVWANTLATAAKIEVTGRGNFLTGQAVFHLLQFVAAGAAIGLAFGQLDRKAP